MTLGASDMASTRCLPSAWPQRSKEDGAERAAVEYHCKFWSMPRRRMLGLQTHWDHRTTTRPVLPRAAIRAWSKPIPTNIRPLCQPRVTGRLPRHFHDGHHGHPFDSSVYHTRISSVLGPINQLPALPRMDGEQMYYRRWPSEANTC